MRNMRIVITLLVLLASAAFLYPGSAWAATSTFQVRGYTVYAYFSSVDSTGCVVTEGSISSDTSSGRGGQPFTEASVDQYDQCRNTLDLGDWGQIDSSPAQISTTLTSASLQATIPATDDLGNPATITVDLTWTSTSGTMHGVNTGHTGGGSFSTSFHDNGFWSEATATGTISDGTTNFASGATQFASIGKYTDGYVEVNH